MAILVDELREYPGVALPLHGLVPHGDRRLVRGAARVRRPARPAARAVPARSLRPAGLTAAPRRWRWGPRRWPTGELLLRMAGARGERARRRVLAPAGVVWLRGPGGPAVLRYHAGALVVIGGPPGAGKSTLAARVADRAPVLGPDDTHADLRAPWPPGRGAVAVTTGPAARARRAPPRRPGSRRTCRCSMPGRASGSPSGRFVREWEAYRPYARRRSPTHGRSPR